MRHIIGLSCTFVLICVPVLAAIRHYGTAEKYYSQGGLARQRRDTSGWDFSLVLPVKRPSSTTLFRGMYTTHPLFFEFFNDFKGRPRGAAMGALKSLGNSENGGC